MALVIQKQFPNRPTHSFPLPSTGERGPSPPAFHRPVNTTHLTRKQFPKLFPVTPRIRLRSPSRCATSRRVQTEREKKDQTFKLNIGRKSEIIQHALLTRLGVFLQSFSRFTQHKIPQRVHSCRSSFFSCPKITPSYIALLVSLVQRFFPLRFVFVLLSVPPFLMAFRGSLSLSFFFPPELTIC